MSDNNENYETHLPPPLYCGSVRLNNISLLPSETSAHVGSNPLQSENSIPTKLRMWYSHKSFKIIVCAFLSTFVLSGTYAALFLDRMSACEILGMSGTILALWMPSPLSFKENKN